MCRLWSVTGLVCLIFAATARADTVYLKNGDTVWGSEVTEVEELVLVFRAGEKVELRKADVERIERTRLSIPRYYAPDGGGGSTASGPPPGTPAGQMMGPPPGMPPGQLPGPPGMPMPPGPPGMGGPISGSPQTGLPVGGGTSSSGSMGSGSAASGSGGSGPSPMGPSGGPSANGGTPGGGGTGTSVTTGPIYGPARPGQASQGGISPRDRDVPPAPR